MGSLHEMKPVEGQPVWWWQPGSYLEAVEKELHAIEAEEHLAVVGCLVCDVPQGTPGELHDLVTLWGGVQLSCVLLRTHGQPWHRRLWDEAKYVRLFLTVLSSSFFWISFNMVCGQRRQAA